MSNPLLFPEYKNLLLNHLAEKSPLLRAKTVQDYGSILRGFLKWKEPHYGDDNLSYIPYLLGRGVSKRTAHSNIMAIRTILKEVSKKNGLSLNDLSEYKKIKYTSVSPMYFTDAQLHKITHEILLDNPYFYLAAALLFSCFIRPNELRHLKGQDINLTHNKITIRGNVSKNGKEQHVSIPVSLRQPCQRLVDVKPREYIFSKKFQPGKTLIGINVMRSYFKRILKRCQIEGNYTFYSLKHTGVVKAVKAGINIKEIQVQLRHHSLDMVNEYLKNLGVYDLEDIDAKMPTL